MVGSGTNWRIHALSRRTASPVLHWIVAFRNADPLWPDVPFFQGKKFRLLADSPG